MKPQLKSSPAARELIKRFEPFQPQAVRGDDGRWVVGFGHHAAAKEGVSVSEKEADLLLIYDVLQAEAALDDVGNVPLKPAQRDALVSFVTDIGARAFKTSDVARYLFEGRAMAAGEALAIYGDANLERREAESALFMTAFAPPVSKKAEEREKSTVELVIKVEHPVEETALEAIGAEAPAEALAASETPEALAEPDAEPAKSEAPAAPPPSAAEMAARRAAEAEIARILAVVGEIPVEELPPAIEDIAEPEAEAELEVELEAEAEPEEVIDAVSEPEVVPEVQAPALEAIIDLEAAEDTVEQEAEADAEALDDGAELEAPAAPETTERKPVEPLIPASRQLASRMIFSGPLDAIQSAPATRPKPPTVPLDSVIPADAEPIVADDVAPEPREVVSETPSEPAAPVNDEAAAQVIARMSQEIEHLPTSQTPAEAGRAHIDTYDHSLPPNATVGFVLAGGLAMHFADDADARTVEEELADLAEAMQDEAGSAPKAGEVFGLGPLDLDADVEIRTHDTALDSAVQKPVDADADAGAASTDETSEAETLVELETATAPESASDSEAGADAEIEADGADLPDALVAQVHDVIEKEVEKVAREETPPPHMMFEPAEAAGAVGEVEAPARERDAAYDVHHSDDLTSAEPVAAERDILEDDFAPADLVGEEDAFTAAEAAPVQSDRSTGWFVISSVAGLGVAIASAIMAVPNLSQIWETRELTLEAWGFLAGSFIFLISVWQLLSVWNEKRKTGA